MERRRGRMGQTSVDRECHRLPSSSHAPLGSRMLARVAGLFTLPLRLAHPGSSRSKSASFGWLCRLLSSVHQPHIPYGHGSFFCFRLRPVRSFTRSSCSRLALAVVLRWLAGVPLAALPR